MHFESLLDAIFTAVAHAFNYKLYVSLTLAGEKACLFTMNRATMCGRCDAAMLPEVYFAYICMILSNRASLFDFVSRFRVCDILSRKRLFLLLHYIARLGHRPVRIFKDNLKQMYAESSRAKQNKN